MPDDDPAPPPIFTAEADIPRSTVYARGELTRHTVDLLWGTTDVLAAAGHHMVKLDLAAVTSIDVTAVTFLRALQHSLATHDGGLIMLNPIPSVFELLRDGQVTLPAS